MTSSNPFNCPATVYKALISEVTDMLQWIRALGPERVQWIGSPPTKPMTYLTSWALYNVRVTAEELFLEYVTVRSNLRRSTLHETTNSVHQDS